jgi:hypothetical protein
VFKTEQRTTENIVRVLFGGELIGEKTSRQCRVGPRHALYP